MKNLFFLITFWSVFSLGAPFEKWQVTSDITWTSQYMTDGFRVGNSPALQLAAMLDIQKTELTLMYWNALQTEPNQKNNDEHDVFLLYKHDFFIDKKFSFNFHGFYNYWVYPNSNAARDGFGDKVSEVERHGNKFHAGVSLTKLFPLLDSFVVPSYNIYHWNYWKQDRANQDQGGNRHELLMQFSHWMPLFIPKSTFQYAEVATSVNYNDGAFGVKPGLSHSTLSISSGAYALSSIFVLSLNQQWSFEPTVNENNILWTSISFVRKLK